MKIVEAVALFNILFCSKCYPWVQSDMDVQITTHKVAKNKGAKGEVHLFGDVMTTLMTQDVSLHGCFEKI